MSLPVEPWLHWLDRVLVLARRPPARAEGWPAPRYVPIEDADLDLEIHGRTTRDRLAAWRADGMSVEIAAATVRTTMEGLARAAREHDSRSAIAAAWRAARVD